MKKIISLFPLTVLSLTACQFGYIKTSAATVKKDLADVEMKYVAATASMKVESIEVKNSTKTTTTDNTDELTYTWVEETDTWVVSEDRTATADDSTIIDLLNDTMYDVASASYADSVEVTFYKGLNGYKATIREETPHEGYVIIQSAKVESNKSGLIKKYVLEMTNKVDKSNYSTLKMTLTASYSK